MKALIILLFPALELYLLVKVGGMIGAMNMVLWVFASAFIGLWAVRAQGRESMNRVRAELAAGRTPQSTLLDGLLLFLAGVLLMLPGLITDAAGLLLLVPPLRALAADNLAARLAGRRASGANIFFFSSGNFGPFFGGADFDSARRGGIAPGEESPGPESGGEDADGPRQATIIESTAIDLGKVDQPGDKEERGRKPGDAPDGGAAPGGRAGREQP